jgi:hypothetical protein
MLSVKAGLALGFAIVGASTFGVRSYMVSRPPADAGGPRAVAGAPLEAANPPPAEAERVAVSGQNDVVTLEPVIVYGLVAVPKAPEAVPEAK